MQYEDSYGAVVFTRGQEKILYAIIQSLEGWYGFPKGHPDPGEAEKEAALREIREETGLTPEIIGDFKTVDEHPIPGKSDVIKRITYFLAESEKRDIRIQEEELLSAAWMPFEEAMAAFQFESSRRILQEADIYLKNE